MALVHPLVGGDERGGQLLVQRQRSLRPAHMHIAHVPTQYFQQGVDELGAHVGLFIVGPLVLAQVSGCARIVRSVVGPGWVGSFWVPLVVVVVVFCTANGWALPAARMRREHLCHRTSHNARGTADLRHDSAVGCKPLLGGRRRG